MQIIRQLFLTVFSALLVLCSSVQGATNATPSKPALFIFDLRENNEGKCLVTYGSKVLTVTIPNAPKTFYAEHQSFAKEDAYVNFHTVRLNQWDRQLTLAESQCATGAAGSSAYVNAVMSQTFRVAQQRALYENQLKDLTFYVDRLNDAKQKDRDNVPCHHIKRCQGMLIRADASGVMWQVVRSF